jgi:signal transduction histidine kinase
MSGLVTWLVSVRGRITVAVTVVFGVAMALGGWFLLDRAENAWIEDLEAADLAELEVLAQDLSTLEELVGDEFFLPVGVGGTSFELFDESGTLVAETPPGVFSGAVIIGGPVPLDEIPPELLTGMAGVIDVGVIGDVTTVSVPVELSSGLLTLTASSSLEPVQAGVSALRGILWIVGPLLVGGVGAASWFVTGRAFRPVADIADQVERITDDRLDERVPVPASRDEVAHLATTMNTMLDRLAEGRRRQREFVSDASHELRNPVATSKTKLEVALAHPAATDWEETAGVVLEEQERLGTLVDDMLLLAKLDEGRPLPFSEVDLDDIVFAEAGRTQQANIDVSAVAAVRVCGAKSQLTRLVRNLVDNATRHAMDRVVLSLAKDGNEAVLAVKDDGPGVPEEHRNRIFERFVRLEDSRSRDEGGAGLGLALVRAVAESHGGSVAAGGAPGGGARFEVRLPMGT